MGFDERWFQGHLREMDEDECWELLAVRPVGRIGYVDDRGPVVLPVTYVVDNRTVLIRVSPYATIGKHLPGRSAAFEVDEIDEYTRSGWSVMVRGDAEKVDADDLSPSAVRPEPWPEGQRTLYVRLTPREVTGRRLLAS